MTSSLPEEKNPWRRMSIRPTFEDNPYLRKDDSGTGTIQENRSVRQLSIVQHIGKTPREANNIIRQQGGHMASLADYYACPSITDLVCNKLVMTNTFVSYIHPDIKFTHHYFDELAEQSEQMKIGPRTLELSDLLHDCYRPLLQALFKTQDKSLDILKKVTGIFGIDTLQIIRPYLSDTQSYLTAFMKDGNRMFIFLDSGIELTYAHSGMVRYD